MSDTTTNAFPTPKFIEGGCLCGTLRYRVDFPDNHDFRKRVRAPIPHPQRLSKH